ncbi:BAG domain-domain-containing protein [Coniella lustricola]|uniref:BAG domain-domain-containing protein n=1 Tax=Coniella lustricola TaxID=2025994 RepID=A0A2T3A2Q0_9PEZI|nr:BAG domain-domain-containing protein [Coniella lustricola]
MSRRGWSAQERGGLSPFNSGLGDGRGGVPEVTDEDYSYITSEDLERSSHYSRSGGGGGPALVIDDDDILLIKHKGVTYPEHFPAFSIGDGKLLVGDVRERVQMIMKLSDRSTRKIRLLYKGRQLKNDLDPICEFNVKNNSEILVVLPEPSDDDSSSESSEEVVVVGREAESRPKKQKKKKSKGKKSKSRGGSPRESNLEIPSGGGPIDKLNTISSHFTTKLLPLCVQFTASPPTDPKKREDEHRKLSETIMQQVLLKLDEVETNGEEEARARRKELVRTVQDVLNRLDSQVNS